MNKSIRSTLLGMSMMLGGMGTAQATLDVAQTPLFLSINADPNIMFIIDDSGSMDWSFIPTPGLKFQYPQYFASATNPMAYNPAVNYTPPLAADGTSLGDVPFNNAPHDGYPSNITNSRFNLNNNYRVTTDIDSTGGNWGSAFYTVYDPAGTGCSPVSQANDSCFRHVDVPGSGEEQNFANWYSYYRFRISASKAAIGFAFSQLGNNVRVGYGQINYGTHNIDGVNVRAVRSGVRAFDSTRRTTFYNWLYGLNPSGGTPLRRALQGAGQYFSNTGSQGPWSSTPGTSGGEKLACRQSYTILMSDGYWNGSSPGVGNVDNSNGPTIVNPNGPDYQYTPSDPFRDNFSDTLADVAMRYWSRDLDTTVQNKVPPNAQDPAFWQHMVTFTIGFGVVGTIDPATAFAAIGTGTPIAWPNPGGGNTEKVDDMLHAGVNGRGGFFSATNPQQFAQALQDQLNNIIGRSTSAAAVASNSTRVSSDTLIYQARFNSGDWTGQFLAFPIQADGSIGSVVWDAANQLPAPAARNIVTWNPSLKTGVDFALANLDSSQVNSLNRDGSGNVDSLAADRVDYLRGDQSQEVANGGPFRNRSSLLGDIINSDPFFVGDNEDYGFQDLPDSGEGDTYISFRNSKKGRTPLLYIGGNDGMLHAFNASKDTANNGGREVFAYIPNAVFDKLSKLTDPVYNHQYFVDGSPFASDAWIGSGWKTVLVGSLGAGGKAVYALDVTDPSSLGANSVMWEFTDPELGYVLGQPVIVRLKAQSGSTKWYAIFGNGYNSQSQTARLFIVELDSGNVAKVIDTGVGGTAAGQENGLGAVLPVDDNGDRITDYVYAGDLKGNLWKFDLTGSSKSQWDVAYKQSGTPVPLFRACTSAACNAGEEQPITARPEAIRHPNGGIMVLFGTGKYFETTDAAVPASPQMQTYYGVLDDGAALTGSRGLLQAQSIAAEGSVGGIDYRTVSQNTVDYTTQFGWYLDLAPPASSSIGERVVSAPIIRYGRVIFTTLIPSSDACDFGGTGWLMELDAINGSRLTYAVMDVNGDGKIDSSDVVGSAYPSGKKLDGLGKPGAIISAGDKEYKFISTSSGTINVTTEAGGGDAFGRQSWNQIK